MRRYGITLGEWQGILDRQGGVCAICQRVPRSGRLAIDHQHVPGWGKMGPKDRRKFVRGLACFLCNGKCISKWVTLARARAVVEYFERYEASRIDGELYG